MLRYTKTVSLALLFSLPAIAMEEQNEQALVPTQEEAAQMDLAQTLDVKTAYALERARAVELTQKKEALKKEEATNSEAFKKAHENLKGKLSDKEKARDSARALMATLAVQISSLPQDKEAAIAKINAENEKQAQLLAAQKEKAAKDVTDLEAEITSLNVELNADKKAETPKKGFLASLFGY